MSDAPNSTNHPPAIPEGALTARAKPFLGMFLPLVTMNGTLNESTMPQFLEMVEVYAELQEARAVVQRDGDFLTTTHKNGATRIRANPAQRVVSSACWRFMRLTDVFEMNPEARHKASTRRARAMRASTAGR